MFPVSSIKATGSSFSVTATHSGASVKMRAPDLPVPLDTLLKKIVRCIDRPTPDRNQFFLHHAVNGGY
jgi:hypothetical protein